MHAYIYARRSRNLAILRKMTINFFGFSNAAFIFFIFHISYFKFSHLLYSTFSHLLYSTFSHLLYFTFSHLLYSTFSHLYIFTSLHLYIFDHIFYIFELLYSSFFPSEFPSLIKPQRKILQHVTGFKERVYYLYVS